MHDHVERFQIEQQAEPGDVPGYVQLKGLAQQRRARTENHHGNRNRGY